MPEGFGYTSDLDSPKSKVKRKPAGHGGHSASSQEFGMTGGSSTVDGYPVDGSAAKAVRKPADYNETGTKARTFT